MTSLVSDNLVGASSSFPRPPQESPLASKQTRRHRFANLLNDNDRKPKQSSRTRERMLSDIHWFMCNLDEQAITSETTRAAGVRTGRWTDIVSVPITSKGVT